LNKYKGTQSEVLVRDIVNRINVTSFSLSMLDIMNDEAIAFSIEESDQDLLKLFYDALKFLILNNEAVSEEFIKWRTTLQYSFITLGQEIRRSVTDLRSGKGSNTLCLSTIRKAFMVMSDSVITLLLYPDRFEEIYKASLILYPVSTKVLADLREISIKKASGISDEEKEGPKKRDLTTSNEQLEEHIQKIIATGNTDRWIDTDDLAKILNVQRPRASYIARDLKETGLAETKREGMKWYVIIRTTNMPKPKLEKVKKKK
jgi:hypothetical protein